MVMVSKTVPKGLLIATSTTNTLISAQDGLAGPLNNKWNRLGMTATTSRVIITTKRVLSGQRVARLRKDALMTHSVVLNLNWTGKQHIINVIPFTHMHL